MRPEGVSHTALSRGIACVLAASPPAHTGGITSSEERGFPPHIPHIRACVSQDRGRVQRPTHWPGGAPGGSFGLAPPGPLCGTSLWASPGLGPHEGPGEPPPWANKTIPLVGGTGLLGCPAGTLFVTRWDSAESAGPGFFPPLHRPRAPPTGGAYRTSLGPRLAGSDGVGRCGPRYGRHGGRQLGWCLW